MKIGLIGFGTVGSGIYDRLMQSQNDIQRMIGKRIEIVSILVKDQKKERNGAGAERVTSSWDLFYEAAECDVVFEAMNGTEPARTYTKALLKAGVSVITANKKLVALHGEELEATAYQSGVYYGWDAAVCGTVPIVNALQSVLPTTQISSIEGILNGTTNFMLSRMKQGKTYKEALEEAQQLGYAEEDPSADVEGYDALYKISLLANLCFGKWIELGEITRQGIDAIEPWHSEAASDLGLTLKLIARAAVNEHGVVTCSVKPAFLSPSHALSHINGVTNGISITGEDIGELVLSGPGAGKQATANSAVEDFVLHEQNWRLRRAKRTAKTNQEALSGKVLWFVREGEEELAEKMAKETTVWSKQKIRGGLIFLVTPPLFLVPFATYQLIGADTLTNNVEKASALF